VRTHAARVVHMTAGMLPGPYRVPAYRAIGHFRLTNKTPAATYRAPGRYETTFVRERLVDAIAHGSASTASRSAGAMLIAPRKCPTRARSKRSARKSTTTPATISGCSTRLLAKIGWDKLNADVKRAGAAGELVGIGVAMFVEKSGSGPTDGVKISVDTSGMVEVVTGGASIGQGFETVMAQVAPMRSASITARAASSTARPTASPFGIGAHASRATVMTGVGDAHRRAEAARQGARSRRRILQTRPTRSTSSTAR
jgi:carbon-monoxide dehydrogenase large subunit